MGGKRDIDSRQSRG